MPLPFACMTAPLPTLSNLYLFKSPYVLSAQTTSPGFVRGEGIKVVLTPVEVRQNRSEWVLLHAAAAKQRGGGETATFCTFCPPHSLSRSHPQICHCAAAPAFRGAHCLLLDPRWLTPPTSFLVLSGWISCLCRAGRHIFLELQNAPPLLHLAHQNIITFI